MLESTCASIDDAHETARALLSKGDADESGSITLEEFTELAGSNPELLTLVEVCMRTPS